MATREFNLVAVAGTIRDVPLDRVRRKITDDQRRFRDNLKAERQKSETSNRPLGN